MSGPADIWVQTADTFEQHLSAVTDDQWATASPCTEWTVRDSSITPSVRSVSWAACSERPSQTVPTGRPFAPQFRPRSRSRPTSRAMRRRRCSVACPSTRYSASPSVTCCSMRGISPTAIGADETLPAEAVQAVYMGFQRMPEPMLRSGGMFGPAIEVADDASEQDKLLAFTGRQP